MSTHNICFHGELEKVVPELSSNTPSPLKERAGRFCLMLCMLGKNPADDILKYFLIFPENRL